MTSQILRLSPARPADPDRQPQETSAGEDEGSEPLSRSSRLPALRTSGSEIDDLIPTLKTIALIVAIAATFVIVLANYPSIIGGAKDIYNAMPPTTITAH